MDCPIFVKQLLHLFAISFLSVIFVSLSVKNKCSFLFVCFFEINIVITFQVLNRLNLFSRYTLLAAR